MVDFPDWDEYLRSVVATYQDWWRLYTLTDAIGTEKPKPESISAGWNVPFQFELMAQTAERQEPRQEGRQEEQQEKTERFPVLEGVRKYATNHVLLSGRPGSGKSTALARLLLEEAQQTLTLPTSPLPILVELRLWENSLLDRILKTLHKHDPNLAIDQSTLMHLLRQGRFLLLLDGLNELPSEAARQDVIRFRADYPQTPMIFTTRELSAGGNFGIGKKLEMQPLTEAQMWQFVQTYLGEAQGEQLLEQLKERLWELGQTPLLLWMLCGLFQQTGTIPPNLGLVFRQFTQGYDRLKRDIPAREESRRWWEMLLQRLAFAMMQGDDPQNRPTEFRVAISKTEAQQIFEATLQIKVADPGDRSIECLNDLLKHHLIQENGNSIEFRHQLLQEYYAAEALLPLLPTLSDAKLKRDYLNYLKWTEPIALMLALVEQEAQALRVVRSALEVDLRLGARLAGAVQPAFQQQTIGLIEALDMPLALKVELLGETRSDVAVPRLVEAIEDADSEVRNKAVEALGQVGSETAIPGLLKALKAHDRWDCFQITLALEEIGSEAAVSGLLKAVVEHRDVPTRYYLTLALGRIGSELAISGILRTIEHPNSSVRSTTTEALSQNGNDAIVLGLVEKLEHPDSDVRWRIASILGQIGSEAAVFGLLKGLQDPDPLVRRRFIEALGEIRNDATVPSLLKLVEHPNALVRERATKALERIESTPTVSKLPDAIEDHDFETYWQIIENLEQSGSETNVSKLLKVIKDTDSEVRWRATHELGRIKSDMAVPALLKAIEDPALDVCSEAVKALGKIGSDEAVLLLIEKCVDPSSNLHSESVKALGQIGNPQPLKLFWQKQLKSPDNSIAQAITDIQNRCKFYNYELFQSEAIHEAPQPSHSPATVIYDQRGATIGNLAHEVHGNQTTHQTPPPFSP